MSLEEAIAVIVPVCIDLQERHARGERLYVHPSAIAPGPDGIARAAHQARARAHQRERQALPRPRAAAHARAGRRLRERLLGRRHPLRDGHRAPRRPGDEASARHRPGAARALEVLIGKAIIGDRAHRPADLGALASAMYHVAPQQSIHPPDVSQAGSTRARKLDVDVRFSMLPPERPAAAASERVRRSRPRRTGGGDPFGAPVIDRTARRTARAAGASRT